MSKAFETYTVNIKRAKNFIEMYKHISTGRGRGRRDAATTDILRAGVVFLHSTFEEYLRSVILDRKIAMLSAGKTEFEKVLANVSLVGDNSGKSSAQKYFLKDLWSVKDKTVFNVVSLSLQDKVGNMTFNDYSQIVSSLSDVGVELSENYNKDGIIDKYIKRRHKIVHEADKNHTNGGRGNYKTSSINTTVLSAWIDAVETMVTAIESSISAM